MRVKRPLCSCYSRFDHIYILINRNITTAFWNSSLEMNWSTFKLSRTDHPSRLESRPVMRLFLFLISLSFLHVSSIWWISLSHSETGVGSLVFLPEYKNVRLCVVIQQCFKIPFPSMFNVCLVPDVFSIVWWRLKSRFYCFK